MLSKRNSFYRKSGMKIIRKNVCNSLGTYAVYRFIIFISTLTHFWRIYEIWGASYMCSGFSITNNVFFKIPLIFILILSYSLISISSPTFPVSQLAKGTSVFCFCWYMCFLILLCCAENEMLYIYIDFGSL